MANQWENFIEIHGGSFLSRTAFEELCYNILDYHYPGKEILSSSDFENKKSRKISVVFLSKVFTDKLTDSRKGQIRNAFNQFIEIKEKKKFKVYAWVFCVPYVLSEDDMKWWLTWKSKNTQKYGVNIEMFDGDYLLQLAKKYNLYEKWWKIEKQEKAESGAVVEDVGFELIDDEVEEIHNEKEEKKSDKENHKELHKHKEDQKQVKDKEYSDKKVIAETKQPASKKKEVNKKDIVFAEKITFAFLQKEFDRLKEYSKNNLSEEQKKQIKKINSSDNWEKAFDVEDVTPTEPDTLKLFYKAKSKEVRHDYPAAYYYYEKILERENHKELLKFKIKDIEKSTKEMRKRTEAFLYELEGDFYKVKGDLSGALEFYEKSYNLYPKNKKLAKKYHEVLADILLEKDETSTAEENYKKALKNEPKDDELQQKSKIAEYLRKAEHFVPFVSFYFYSKAYKLKKDDKIKEKLDLSVKKSYYWLSGLIVLALVTFLLITTNKKEKTYEETTVVHHSDLAMPVRPVDIAERRGDSIMQHISYEKIHLIDTAIAAYSRAMQYRPSNELKIKLDKAKAYKNDYVKMVQTNIWRDSAAYFISMRRLNNGLRLFKYLFEPNNPAKGKYGYVDSTMRVVVPPVYDFDYYKMYKGTENFNDGKALVCLKLSDGHTMYMYIDRNCKIKEIVSIE